MEPAAGATRGGAVPRPPSGGRGPGRQAGLTRASRFSHRCRRCGRCCHHQAIQLNPYEILRLARSLGMPTTRFIATHTTEGGRFLRFDGAGACPFLAAEGCAVHRDRPLVCRLYPLGRELEGDREGFLRLPSVPGCRAERDGEGGVADYLAGQGARPYLAAADAYLALFGELLAELAAQAARRPGLGEWARREFLAKAAPGETPRSPWLDVDWALTSQAGLAAGDIPADPARATRCHRQALRAWWARELAKKEDNHG